MKVKPRDGFKIYDPDRQNYLPPEGREVPYGHLYWARLLRDGDVVEVFDEPADAAPLSDPAPAAGASIDEAPLPPKPVKPGRDPVALAGDVA
jgi:hypothetical protein